MVSEVCSVRRDGGEERRVVSAVCSVRKTKEVCSVKCLRIAQYSVVLKLL